MEEKNSFISDLLLKNHLEGNREVSLLFSKLPGGHPMNQYTSGVDHTQKTKLQHKKIYLL